MKEKDSSSLEMEIVKVHVGTIDPLFRSFDRAELFFALFYNSILKIRLAYCISLGFICTCTHCTCNNIQRLLKCERQDFQ